jgi:hypothetical protein
MTNPENHKSRNITAAIITSLVVGAWIYGTFFKSSSCYDQAAEGIGQREGNRAIHRSDVERYASKLTNSCR